MADSRPDPKAETKPGAGQFAKLSRLYNYCPHKKMNDDGKAPQFIRAHLVLEQDQFEKGR
jgi:hypothetical protein